MEREGSIQGGGSGVAAHRATLRGVA